MALTESYANLAQTVLTAAITSAGQTSISVASATGFPTSGNYRIRIDNEFMLVTGGQGTTTWTVTRGAEDAARYPATTHLNGAAVYGVFTAGAVQSLIDYVSSPTTGHVHDGSDGRRIDRPWLGDGADGNVTISSDTVLTRDMFYNSLTVNAGVKLDTNGFRVFVKGTANILGTVEFDLTDYPSTTLANTMTSGQTTMDLSGYSIALRRHGWDAMGFTTNGVAQMLVDSEVIGVVSPSLMSPPSDRTQTFTLTTVLRGMRGTTAAAHNAGAKVMLLRDGAHGADDVTFNNSGSRIGPYSNPQYFGSVTRTTPIPKFSVPGGRSSAQSGGPITGTVATVGTSSEALLTGSTPAGGAGGAGGAAGGGQAGGAGAAGGLGASAVTPVYRGVYRTALDAFFATVVPFATGPTSPTVYVGSGPSSGGGGGNGGSSASPTYGGWGGSSGQDGGVVFIACRTLAGNGTIRSLGSVGGNGGNGRDGNQVVADAGGGGGGGAGNGGRGGVVCLIYTDKTFTGTISTAGGAAGTPGSGGTSGGGTGSPGSAGQAGSAGSSGLVLEFVA